MSNETPVVATNFIRNIIIDDLESGKHQHIVTRFPPEPNGHLHIGHAKSICLNFGLAEEFGGKTNLRFDDTNPLKENEDFMNAIMEDVRWLGFEWDNLFHASDYFGQLYDFAVHLIETGKAYVEELSADEILEYRGDWMNNEPGRESPWRDRPAEESLDLFARMKNGEFEDGKYVLRAKIDMASPDRFMRDPVMYRIRNASHHRTGDAWHIYPMYDWAHGISDAPAWQVSRMQAIAELRGWSPLVALQVPYNLAERTVEREFMPMAREMGLGVLPWSPLAGGVLSGKYSRQDLDAAPGELRSRREINLATGRLTPAALDIAATVAEIAGEMNRTPAQVALAWTLLNPAVTSPIIGARTFAQFEDNLGALEVDFSEEQRRRLDEVSAVETCFPHNMIDSPTSAIMFGAIKVAARPARY